MSKPCQHAASGCDYPAGECIGECKTAQPTDPVPAGWKLVPVEPTRDMLTAWIKAVVVSNTTAPALYRAMLTAAPQPPVVEQVPVAWAIFVDSGNARMWSTFQPHIQKFADAEGLSVTPLYTHPQPRQPLTEEQIGEIGSKCEKFAKDGSEWFDRWMFARAIERAHGIGGEA